MSIAAFNPNDPTQQAFLAMLQKGENAAGNPTLGFGGADLSHAGTDEFGFPQWAGVITGDTITHAAGLFQFQPGTWDGIASQFNLNFSNPQDQAAGAWYLAQQTFTKNTGGDLTTALQNGDTSQVDSALSSVWTSLGSGNANSAAAASGGTGLWGNIEDFFVRFGLIIIGGAIVLVALWALLSNAGVVPKASDVAKSVGEAGPALLAAL
jgi:hypothetical protein